MAGLIERINMLTLKRMFLINSQLQFLSPTRQVIEKESDFKDSDCMRPGVVHEENDNDEVISTTEGGEQVNEAAMEVDPPNDPEVPPPLVFDQHEMPFPSRGFEEDVTPPFVPSQSYEEHVAPPPSFSHPQMGSTFQAGSSSSFGVPYFVQEQSTPPMTHHSASSSSRVEDKLDLILMKMGHFQRSQQADHETLRAMHDNVSQMFDRQIVIQNEMAQLRNRVNTMQLNIDDFCNDFDLRFHPPPSP